MERSAELVLALRSYSDASRSLLSSLLQPGSDDALEAGANAYFEASDAVANLVAPQLLDKGQVPDSDAALLLGMLMHVDLCLASEATMMGTFRQERQIALADVREILGPDAAAAIEQLRLDASNARAIARQAADVGRTLLDSIDGPETHLGGPVPREMRMGYFPPPGSPRSAI